MAGGQRAVLNHRLDGIGQGQQAHHVGDMAAALADGAGQILLRVLELLHQAAIALRLFQRSQILALDVLDQRDFQRLAVAEIADDDRNLVQAGDLRGSPAALAGDQLVGVRVLAVAADQQGLQDALVADGVDEALDGFLV